MGVGGRGVAVGASAVETARAMTSNSAGNEGEADDAMAACTPGAAGSGGWSTGAAIPWANPTQMTAAAIPVREIESNSAIHCWTRDWVGAGAMCAGLGRWLGSTFLDATQIDYARPRARERG